SENRRKPKRKSSKVAPIQTRKSSRVAQLEKTRSNEGDQSKPGPSGLTKKRKIADREVNSDVQQVIINDSPSTSAGTRSKRVSFSSKVVQPKTRKSPRVSQAEKCQSKRGKRLRDDPSKPSPG